ncbi:hypothetical protein PE067_14055 [Paracoccus sp. DMF-8]|uniref:hypothetical protein n=1 Tax=Paracoccus sp. DMF-8 TaxID=3019445 RepID=UPI0023E7D59A|nr:hypothetical protein [Paracoccus sp. DMF-8]MDF3607159.1 hypothetical protein [Paracoccus sp. DMF-8]
MPGLRYRDPHQHAPENCAIKSRNGNRLCLWRCNGGDPTSCWRWRFQREFLLAAGAVVALADGPRRAGTEVIRSGAGADAGPAALARKKMILDRVIVSVSSPKRRAEYRLDGKELAASSVPRSDPTLGVSTRAATTGIAIANIRGLQDFGLHENRPGRWRAAKFPENGHGASSAPLPVTEDAEIRAGRARCQRRGGVVNM